MQKRAVYFWTLFGFAISVGAIYYFARNIVLVESVIKRAGIVGPLVSVLLYGLLSATPIPTDSLTLLNGALFGPIVGISVSTLGNTLAALIEYYIGFNISGAANFEEQKKKLPFGIDKYPVNSVGFLLFGRFLPGFGGKIVSLVGGLYKVSLWRYTWTALISNFIGAILFAIGGYGLFKNL